MLFISGSSDDVHLPLSALISSFWTFLDSLNCFWDSSACLELFLDFSGLLELRLGSSGCLDSVWTMCFCLFLVCVSVLSCVGRLCAKVPLWSNDVAVKGHKRWPKGHMKNPGWGNTLCRYQEFWIPVQVNLNCISWTFWNSLLDSVVILVQGVGVHMSVVAGFWTLCQLWVLSQVLQLECTTLHTCNATATWIWCQYHAQLSRCSAVLCYQDKADKRWSSWSL